MRQNSEFPLAGSTKKFTFFSTKDGDFARPKGKKIDKKRIDTDPKFETTRKHYKEFAWVMNSAKLIRNTFRLLVKNAKSGNTGRRLTSLLFNILKADTANEHGQRRITSANAQMLERFDFNDNVKLSNRLFAKFTTSVNRSTGDVDVVLQPLIPTDGLNAPAGATHYKFVLAASELDLENQLENAKEASSDHAPIDGEQTESLHLSAKLTPNSTSLIVAVLAVEFYKQNGTTFTLLPPTALSIISATKP